MRVLFTTNIPSPYRVDFFNELGKCCDLTVLFENQSAKNRDVSWKSCSFENFKAVFMKGIRYGEAEAFCPEVIKFLPKYDLIVIGMYSSLTGMLAIEYMRLHKIPFILSSDGGIRKNEARCKYWFKKHFIGAASAWLSTSKVTNKYLQYYGAKPDNITIYPFSSIKQDDLTRRLTAFEKQRLREKLGVLEKKVIVSVGQFIHRKGYDVLLEASVNLDKDVGVYIIGGVPTEEYVRLKKELKLSNVHFLDFMKKDELKEYYRMADLFVLPTREDIWGLVINEAMAYGLPVVTTEKCVAGLELISDQAKNGVIVPTDNPQLLFKGIVSVMDKAEEYGENALSMIKEYTIERMALCHLKMFNSFINR